MIEPKHTHRRTRSANRRQSIQAGGGGEKEWKKGSTDRLTDKAGTIAEAAPTPDDGSSNEKNDHNHSKQQKPQIFCLTLTMLFWTSLEQACSLCTCAEILYEGIVTLPFCGCFISGRRVRRGERKTKKTRSFKSREGLQEMLSPHWSREECWGERGICILLVKPFP